MTTGKKLLIIGASGHGRVIVDIALKMNKWQEVSFLDDDETLNESMGIKVVGKVKEFFYYIDSHEIFVAIGNNSIRKKIQNQIIDSGGKIPILIHPNTVIGEDVGLGVGTVIMAGVIISCCSKIGNGCIVNTGATIDHDCLIEDFVHICPGVNLAGTVRVGENSWIGIGSVISNNLNIFSDCKLGAGAVVIQDINESGTYVGVPARRLKR